MNFQITVFWDVTLCSLTDRYHCSEGTWGLPARGGSRFLQNTSNYVPNYMVSHLRRHQSYYHYSTATCSSPVWDRSPNHDHHSIPALYRMSWHQFQTRHTTWPHEGDPVPCGCCIPLTHVYKHMKHSHKIRSYPLSSTNWVQHPNSRSLNI
jgi:hypothetical protein